jgi:hypothetical protein
MRANRIFARMLEGQAYPEIAAAEGLRVRRGRVIVQEALDRWISSRARICARPDRAARRRAAAGRGEVADGRLGAAPQLIRLIEQRDRWHGGELMRRRIDASTGAGLLRRG